MAIAAAFFFASLAGLAALFSLKAYEAKRGVLLAPGLRASADRAALSLKASLFDLRAIIARLPPLLVLLSRYALRELALGAAKLARAAEAQMYKVADFVSHKRNFERREPKNEFLKKVEEVKNGNGHDEVSQ